MKRTLIALMTLAFALAVAGPAFAEDPAAGPAQEAKVSSTSPVKTEILRLKYYPAVRMMQLINTYLSREGRVSQGPDEKILAISDHAENIARIREAVAEVDVKPADLLFTVQLILGSDEEEKGAEPMPSSDPIIKQLRGVLKYKAYSLLDTSLMRALDQEDSQVRLGERGDFELRLKPKVVRDTPLIQTEVRLRQIRIAGLPAGATSSKPEYIVTDLIGTTLNVKSGDKTVVGVSKLDGTGKALILIVSGKIVD